MEELMQEDTLKQFLPATESWFRKTFGEPTKIQREAWPAIADGKHVLVSAPTGTGKTLSAFLVFIDQLGGLAERGELKEELYVIYVSPLKSLAGDIRENLRKPLEGIGAEAHGESKAESRPSNPSIGQIQAAIRTGDTPQKERQRMVKHPPHILIITPESLYLMLTSKSGGRQPIAENAQNGAACHKGGETDALAVSGIHCPGYAHEN